MSTKTATSPTDTKTVAKPSEVKTDTKIADAKAAETKAAEEKAAETKAAEEKAAKAKAKEDEKVKKEAEKVAKAKEREEAKAKKKLEEPARRATYDAGDIYLTSKPTAPESVFGWMQRYLEAQGGSCKIGQLRTAMLKDFKAKTSKSFKDNPDQYVQAYIRGGLKDGWFSVTPVGVTKARAPALTTKSPAEKTVGPTAFGQKLLDELKTTTSDIEFKTGTSKTTIADLADQSGNTKAAVSRGVQSLVDAGYVTLKDTEKKDGKFVIFTEKGWTQAADKKE